MMVFVFGRSVNARSNSPLHTSAFKTTFKGSAVTPPPAALASFSTPEGGEKVTHLGGYGLLRR